MARDPDKEPEPTAEHDELPPEADGYPPIDFTTFVLSMSTSAMIHLGEHPEAHEAQDLALARQTIDVLGVLEEKTRGNLSGEEERILQQVLFDLRMRYLAKLKAAGGGGKAPEQEQKGGS